MRHLFTMKVRIILVVAALLTVGLAVLGSADKTPAEDGKQKEDVSVPKTLVRTLVRWAADNKFDTTGDIHRTLLDIVDTPISPELLPADDKGEIAQKTEDTVGPYELHDFFIYYALRYGYCPSKIYRMCLAAWGDVYDEETVKKWLKTFYRRFFTQQFKRSCMPDGPAVGKVSLSPRGGLTMPSDASFTAWVEEAEQL